MKTLSKLKILQLFLLFFLIISCRENITQFPDEGVTGAIYISSAPPGASIFIRGTYMQKQTPVWLEDLDAGNYFLTLKLEGYADTSFFINLEENAKRYFTVSLKANY